jgi:hypothetical protein
MRWYADNSELASLRGAQIPDVVLFGGVVVPENTAVTLRTAIEGVKAKYGGDPRAPVKWNFKDLEALYRRHRLKELYAKLHESTKEWRRDIFAAVAELDFKIIISCVESYSTSRGDIKVLKPDLCGFAFANGLMRFALHVQETKPTTATVILDWPENNDPAPFNKEYSPAYLQGTSTNPKIFFYSGPLKHLNFSDSVLYSQMKHTTLLQFVGATREFIECALGKRGKDALGLEVLKSVKSCFYGAPNRIFGRGISVSSGSVNLRKSVREAIETQLWA